jgi:hypothetical protein
MATYGPPSGGFLVDARRTYSQGRAPVEKKEQGKEVMKTPTPKPASPTKPVYTGRLASFLEGLQRPIPAKADLRLEKERDASRLCTQERSVVYGRMLRFGLTFPLPSLFEELLDEYQCSPAQLHYNVVCYIMAFTLQCKKLGVEPRYELLKSLVCLRRGQQHFTFYPLTSRKLFTVPTNNA